MKSTKKSGIGTIASDIISVQPMNQPSGLVFYMDFKYGDKDYKPPKPINRNISVHIQKN